MDLGLKGKVALVTGAGSQKGFGRAIAVALAKEGCDLIVADIDLQSAKQTEGEIKNLGRQAIAVKADITDSQEVNDMVKVALDRFGKIDILVNNAGAATPPKLFIDTTEDEWDFNIDLNLKGMLKCTKAVLDHMIPRKSGKIINLSSFGAKTGGENTTVYAAAKAGVIGFSKALAKEWGKKKIQTNVVVPGYFDTALTRANATDIVVENFVRMSSLRRAGQGYEYGRAVVFLASELSSFINGYVLEVTGGLDTIPPI